MDESVKIKKLLQNIVNYILENKKYSDFADVEVSGVNKAPYKTAMCNITYELKIHTNLENSLRDELIKDFQMDVKKHSQSIISDSICAIDVEFLN